METTALLTYFLFLYHQNETLFCKGLRGFVFTYILSTRFIGVLLFQLRINFNLGRLESLHTDSNVENDHISLHNTFISLILIKLLSAHEQNFLCYNVSKKTMFHGSAEGN